LVFTVILSALSLFGWYNLGWAFGLLFLFLTVIVALMMIYKELSSQQDKDRFVVLLLSFIMVIIFWGAFEQAGGLMNLYTDAKTDRMLLGWQVPTVMFQSLNAGFIMQLV
jgi:POT family proton-dependent oligopeptide transporter